MMVELNEDSIRKSGSLMMMQIWRNVYNNLCKDCKKKLFIAASDLKLVGTEAVANRMDEIIKNGLCLSCKNRVDAIMKRYDR